MISFKAVIERFGDMGEKTGWYYIEINSKIAGKLLPGNKKSFRVKGCVNNWTFEKQSLLPMGDGDFIMALNAAARKGIGARMGEVINVQIETDARPVLIDQAFMDCLADEPKALDYFNSLPAGHRNYFSKWIESAKTEETKSRRIAEAVNSLAAGLCYGEMIRSNRKKKI